MLLPLHMSPYSTYATSKDTLTYNTYATSKDTLPFSTYATSRNTLPYNTYATSKDTLPYNTYATSKDTVTYCARCKLEISELELIHKSMRGVYHRRCFYCDVCHVQLKDGDSYYALRDSSALMCKLDFETASGKASYTRKLIGYTVS